MLSDSFHKNVQTTANVAIVLTLFFGVGSLWYQFDLQRYDRTVSLTSRLYENPLLGSQQRILNALIGLPLEELQGKIVERSFVAELMSQVVQTSDNPLQLRQDIITITAYFDDLNDCAINGVCDANTVNERVGEVATRFACSTLPYVEQIREKSLIAGLGQGLAKLARYEKNC